MNWSQAKKFFVTFEICLLTTGVYIGSAIYSAGIGGVVKQFGVSQVAATLGLCLFVAGYGIGPMLWAPMSEIPQIGRNPVYIGTLALFVVLQVPTALATSFGMLLTFRFITGFVGSPVLATGGASLTDMYKPSKRAFAISIWGVAAVCGVSLIPVIFIHKLTKRSSLHSAPWSAVSLLRLRAGLGQFGSSCGSQDLLWSSSSSCYPRHLPTTFSSGEPGGFAR
jgi:MFS family permease